ncbi:MAG: Nramp family divalent metal transporter [Streptomyces sp.]|nr:Nramp family divalent metal transporter [Streptomyces sp.]
MATSTHKAEKAGKAEKSGKPGKAGKPSKHTGGKEPGGRPGRLRRAWQVLGPGLVTGASDDDPSGIATYAQAGAKFRYGLLWTALITLPLMSAVQEICDRTALATGRSLGALSRERFRRSARTAIGVLLVALVAANVLNIAADLVAVGSGMNLLHAGPAWIWALVAGAAITALIVFGAFDLIARVFKVLCLALLSYVVVLFAAHVPWGTVGLHTIAPHFTWSTDYLTLLIAVLGTTISPYLFFWQTADRVEEMRQEAEKKTGDDNPKPLPERSRAAAERKQRRARADVFTGMAFSNLVMFAVITATAATLGKGPGQDITSAAQAAQALKPAAGSAASTIFALGFIGSGMLAVPVLAGSGSAGLAGLLGKPWGLSKSVREAPAFYGLLAAGTVGGTLLTLTAVDPIKLLVLAATVNGIAAAPFLLVVMIIAGNKAIMGEHRNGRLAATLGWTTFGIMTAAAVAMIVLIFTG